MGEPRTPIRCFVSPSGRNKISDWYEDLSPQDKAAADAFVGAMHMKLEWDWPEYRKSMKGAARGLGELRWSSQRVEHRLIGYFHDGNWVALLGCTHKGKVYSPSGALETALQRKTSLANGEASTVAYDL
jgi:hypothetical protein